MTDNLETYIQLNSKGLVGENSIEDYIENHTIKTASFIFQNGPIKEVGKNGVQYDVLIKIAKAIIEKLNKCHPCDENIQALIALEQAVHWLEERTRDRITRGVEGTDND